MFSMASYLTQATPDYDYTLEIPPKDIIGIVPLKTQKRFLTDDNLPHVVNIQDGTKFLVKLNYRTMDRDVSSTIIDLWTDTSKANGSASSFCLLNPIDSEIYVVKFWMDGPTLNHNMVGYDDIDTIDLLVLGSYGS